ncbi:MULTISPECIES: hypothetical protein [unclassified Microbacterium]|uniref:hypothetical protein n=1 Tax=unclassified Microbacterium TaxID=2609290 RepID=UPI00160512C3|nr:MULTISPECIES: hypothetical protein [unclassified Microbacterium]QNA93538.1 hypothetical protein G4G29_16770 [Microbacterium sp. Se63.02b]QYM63790.1 hypothetical protein K1X59_16830 [Microbacterium sp. Se5.02b]
MRLFSGLLLWLVATVSGVMGAGWFSLAGLGWSGGFITRSYWDDESGIGVAFGIFGLVVWLGLLGASFAVLRGGAFPATRGMRIASVVLTIVSVVAVVTVCALAIGWPEPPSEFPTPPWNRA